MEKRVSLKLQIFMFLTSASGSAFCSFLPVYLSDRKLSFTEIGIVFAINALIATIIQPIWGYLSDKYFNKKKTLIISIIFNMLTILLFIKAQNFSIILTLIIANNLFMCAIGPITDAFVFDIIEERRDLSYSNFRLMSSAAAALVNLALGYFLKYYSINYIFIIYDVLAVCALVLLYSMKFQGKKSLVKVDFSDIKTIFKNEKLIIFFITIFLMNAAFMAGINYMNELIKYNNGDVSKLGAVWFVTCAIEVLTFFAAVKLLRKFGIINIYIISMFLYAIKFIMDFIFKDANYIIAVQAIEGVAFTLYITSSLEYLNMNTDAKIRATAMSIYAAFGGFGVFSASLTSGVLLNIINPSQLYGLLGGLCFVSMFCAVILKAKRTST